MTPNGIRGFVEAIHTNKFWTERLGVPVRASVFDGASAVVVVLVPTDVPPADAIYVWGTFEAHSLPEKRDEGFRAVALRENERLTADLEREWRTAYPGARNGVNGAQTRARIIPTTSAPDTARR